MEKTFLSFYALEALTETAPLIAAYNQYTVYCVTAPPSLQTKWDCSLRVQSNFFFLPLNLSLELLQNSYFDRYSIVLTFKYNNEGVIKDLDVEESTIEKKISSNSLLTLLGFADKNVHKKDSVTFLTVPLYIVAILINLILAKTNPFYVVRY